jgi:2-octaprenyl-6-methoxyphenol hydroxylase
MSLTTDIAVVGGGLVGRAAAIVAAQAGFAVVHLAPKGPPDRRTSALMMPSVDFLTGAGLVDRPEAIAEKLTQIRIIDATGRLIRAPETLFDSSEAGREAFGWNFPNAALGERFDAVAETLPGLSTMEQPVTAMVVGQRGAELTLGDGSMLSAQLVVGADGKGSLVRRSAGFATRERKFEQSALVCNLELGRPLNGASVEFHYPNGPFTLVPAGGARANLVWIDALDVLEAAKRLEPAAFTALLEEKSQRLFGHLGVVGPTQVFPLSTLSVEQAGAPHVVLAGESAHAFPPIGAQGLNLGLRDVADLAAVLSDTRREGNWGVAAGQHYSRRRDRDLRRTGVMVDALFRSLLTDMLPAQALRAGGLWALKLLPGLRKQAFVVGMGAR